MINSGFISLHRKILDWEWYSDINVSRLFIHLLLIANYENKQWQGRDIKRGETITSISNLALNTGLSNKQVRVALNKLKLTSEVAIKTTNKYTMITICNYESYQNIENNKGNQKGNQKANEGQTEGNQRANKGQQLNNINKDNNDNKDNNNMRNKINYDFMVDPYKNHFINFLEYKKSQFNFSYKTQKSLEIAYYDFVEKSKNNPEQAEKIVKESISKGWKGLFELKTNGVNSKTVGGMSDVSNVKPEDYKLEWA